jgi:hypothetical protein
MVESVRRADEAMGSLSTRITGHLTEALQNIPQMFINAFVGGGGVVGALKGIGVSLLNAIVKEILDPIMAMVAKWAVGIAMKIAGAFVMPSMPTFGGSGAGAAGGGLAGGLGMAAGVGILAAGGGFLVNDILAGHTGYEAPSGWINGVYVPPANTPGPAPPEAPDRFLGPRGFQTSAGRRPYEFASGTGGKFVDFGAGTTVRLHGQERVMTKTEDSQNSADIRGLRAEMAGLRHDFTFVLPTLLAKAVTKHNGGRG